MSMPNNQTENYRQLIADIKDLTINDIISVSNRFIPDKYKSHPYLYMDAEGRKLEHGTAVLETEEQCNAYMAAYGQMHYEKLKRAFDKSEFPFNQIHYGVEIYDWGCGQGIGTLTLIEKFREKGLLSLIKKITLEEPSDVARSRAVFHVNRVLNKESIEVVDIPYFLPSDQGNNDDSIVSIDVQQPIAIHLFSNILDIESVSLKGVSKMITSSGREHIVLCVGPANRNESRINSFKNYFKSDGVHVFTDFRDTCFRRHPDGKAYGCFIKSFTYSLSKNKSVLHEYKYFAPVQLFASYSDSVDECNFKDAAFEISAPFDMSAHKNLHPVYALISNLISRGCPTYASTKVLEALRGHSNKAKIRELKIIAMIHKTLIEAMISNRLLIDNVEWKVLILEDNTNIAQIAVDDFCELYNHLICITEEYYQMTLPAVKLFNKNTAECSEKFDLVLDVSSGKNSNLGDVEFSKYKALNDCYFVVRSSEKLFDERYLYTTERIKYKSFVEKDSRGIYVADENIVCHLRYFLNLIFRKEDFRPGQLPILSRALQLKSVIGLLPTGGGKSLTYQLAAMLQPAVTLVVDPLKGLMKDQYDGLLRIGIDSISYINSDITVDRVEANRRQNALTGSQIQIMFLSPERLSIHRFREVLRSMRESGVYFAYGVIDEVHCVSEWGHDFRLAYLHLGRNLYNYVLPKEVDGKDNHISLFGLTATASFDVLADVERELSGNNSYSWEDDATVRYENTNRLELQYYVYQVNCSKVSKAWDVGDVKEEVLLDAIDDATEKIQEIQDEDSIDEIKRRFLERENIKDAEKTEEIYSTDLNTDIDDNWYSGKNTDTAGIVFCLRASERSNLSVPSVANSLRLHNINRISTYKGGDDTRSQDEFLSDATSMMVATKAFGMGIDKPNVRLTVHLNYPGSLESFVQEAGRAGRDRKMALATIMYSPKTFPVKNARTGQWNHYSADYINNKFFYDSNFLGEEFELYVMQLLMNSLQVSISNEEIAGMDSIKYDNSNGILQFIKRYSKGTTLTYYISYAESESVLDDYNLYLRKRNMPLFNTWNAKNVKNDRGFSYIRDYGSADYKDAIQKAIYRMCVIGLINDFTEDYTKKTFRITTKCQDESCYYDYLRLYYRKYYSEDRVNLMLEEVKQMAVVDGSIMACLKYLTSFIYRSIADKRARGIMDMEQFCNMAINSGKDWKETNEDLKDFIYYYFNSKYAREGYATYDSSPEIEDEMPFSLKDDTNSDIHSEAEISSFELVKKYMRVVDPEIVNNDSQTDNIKHLQGAVRLIRRAVPEMNPVLNLLNIFCIFFLGQQNNEMLEEEIFNDYKAVMELYNSQNKLEILNKYTTLLIQHGAISEEQKDYIEKFQLAIQLEQHIGRLKEITNKYIEL